MSPELRGLLATIALAVLIWKWPRRKRPWRDAQRETVAEQRRRNFDPCFDMSLPPSRLMGLICHMRGHKWRLILHQWFCDRCGLFGGRQHQHQVIDR